ncbi:MAG: hypothetical protein QOF16_428 [Actinomycetota bacterium]|nr:hypothetical protein [Actinomycetota bacterium]
MEELVRCPNCGASNPRSATWCGQCQTPFAPSVPAEQAVPSPSPSPPVAPEARQPEIVERPATESPPVTDLGLGTESEHGPFTVGEEGITWICGACGSSNPLDLPLCSVCGATFKDTVEPDERLPERDPNTTALVALVYPGAGFAYLGRWPEAIGRAVVGTFALSVALIAALVGSGSVSAVIGITYGLAAFGLWVLGVHDAYRAAQHQEALVVLKARMLLYVLLGLLVLFLVLLVGAIVSRTSR